MNNIKCYMIDDNGKLMYIGERTEKEMSVEYKRRERVLKEQAKDRRDRAIRAFNKK